MNKGVILINLGSPESPNIFHIKKYLYQFLMDENVIDYPLIFRKLIVKKIIIPFRSKKTSHAYSKIWTANGSPLIYNTNKIKEKLIAKINNNNFYIEIGMRYGEPSIKYAIEKLIQKSVNEILFIPLYPHSTISTTGSVIKEIKENMKKYNKIKYTYLKEFYTDDDYIESISNLIKKEYCPDSILVFSYHGIPIRHEKFNNTSVSYKNQCLETSYLISKKINIDKNKYISCFQSKLGPERWLTPSTIKTLNNIIKNKIKKVTICTPSFICDCVETLEEINIQARNKFLKNETYLFKYVPCLNDNDIWINTLYKWIKMKFNI